MATIVNYIPNKLGFPKTVYIDANFLISFYVPKHKFYAQASCLLYELMTKKVEIQASLLSIDEALYALMAIDYEDKNGKGKWVLDAPMKTDPGFCANFAPELNKFINALSKHPHFKIMESPTTVSKLLSDCLSHIASYSLGPRDALHLAFLKAAGIDTIITNDTDFERVSDKSLLVLHFW